ncbi:hypothetical protein PCE1_003729 [Barthelona sp. PCE]
MNFFRKAQEAFQTILRPIGLPEPPSNDPRHHNNDETPQIVEEKPVLTVAQRLRLKKERIDNALLNSEVFTDDEFREICFEGVPPNSDSHRGTLWLPLLLIDLPRSYADWKQYFSDKKDLYNEFVRDFYHGRPTIARDPLGESPEWDEYYKDQDIKFEIAKDVVRTHRGLHFFNIGIDAEGLEMHTPSDEIFKVLNACEHHAALHRILFVLSKVNPALQYVQGMNELSALIYYVLYNSTSHLKTLDIEFHAESAAFWAMNSLLSDIGGLFSTQMDQTEAGMRGAFRKYRKLMRKVDPEMDDHFRSICLEEEFYLLSWITLFFTQLFSLPDVIPLWDFFLSEKNSTSRLNRVLIFAVSIFELEREKYLSMNLSEILTDVQEVKAAPNEILKHAKALVKEFFPNTV